MTERCQTRLVARIGLIDLIDFHSSGSARQIRQVAANLVAERWNHFPPESLCMKVRLFFGGLLVGVAIGLMVGGAVVKIPADGSGTRQYPQGIALLLALVGGIAAGSALRGSATSPSRGE